MVLPAVLRGAGAGASGGGWLQAALFQGLPTIANLFGARMQVGASDRASEIQARSAREALDEIRRQYDIDRAEESRRYEADVTAFAPYNEVGGRSVTRMGDLALSAQPEPYRPVPIRDTPLPPRGSMADLSRPTGQAQSGRGTVMMQAPTGQRKAVPMSQVSWWESRGARRVA